MTSWQRFAALFMALGLIAAACGDSDSNADADCNDEDVVCVGLVTDTGKVDDKSFNQSAWEGAQAAAESLGAAKVDFIETEEAKDYEANIQLFLDDGYDIIVTVGFGMGEATAGMGHRLPK